MNENSFSKMNATDQRLYGPRSLMVTGYPIEDQPFFIDLFAKLGLTDVSIKFISESMADQSEKWPISVLLDELSAEKAVVEKDFNK